MEVLDAKGVAELREKLFACKHPITSAGANVLDLGNDPIGVLLDVIQNLAAHAVELEDLATKKAELSATSIVIPAEDVSEEVLAAMPGSQMESTTVYATKDQMAALRAMSGETGVPMAEYIRRGIDLVLTETEERLGDSPKVVASS